MLKQKNGWCKTALICTVLLVVPSKVSTFFCQYCNLTFHILPKLNKNAKNVNINSVAVMSKKSMYCFVQIST